MTKGHGDRAHSKYSASGAERYFACPGSVALSEGLPDKPSPWALEGTDAHEVLERILVSSIRKEPTERLDHKGEMFHHGVNAARFILDLAERTPGSDVLVESRVYLSFIHPEMFGTLDAAVVDYFGTLHVFDYKYGAGKPVSPVKNLQMIFYALGLGYSYRWNFRRARLWIIQPRIKGYEGPVYWDLSIRDLRYYVRVFQIAVEEVEKNPKKYVEGSWCHWCRAKSICPLKQAVKFDQAKSIFTNASEVG